MRKYTDAEATAVFWSNVDRSAGANACWPWTAHLNNRGYGRWHFRGKKRYAHRIAAFLVGRLACLDAPKGDPNRTYGLHTCDTPACCNPAHVFPGTQTDNMQDCLRKGRNNAEAGARSRAKLNNVIVLECRRRNAAGESKAALAREFGISQPCMSYAIRGITYRRLK